MVIVMDADQILERARTTLHRLADFKVEHRLDDELLRRDWIPPRLRKPEQPASGLIFKDAPQEPPPPPANELVDIDYLQRAMESMASVLGEEVALIETRIVERQSDEIAALRDLVETLRTQLADLANTVNDQQSRIDALESDIADVVDRAVKQMRKSNAA
ncbi:hypothetical protein ACSHT2_13955 [Bradyrhizobium sp. PUT101]|uniref:hypothetical protein n=1 Tax=Bradyrhizobium sp. PUT101 TaxID=3447427 RepID=UPI003F848503